MIRWSHPARDVPLPAPLHAHAVERSPLTASASTAELERLVLPGGRTLVSKRFSPAVDWMMRMTHDSGRAAELWVDGVMDRCPPDVDPALVRIEDEDGDAWRLYMDEVSFHPAGTRFSPADIRLLLQRLAALHETFWGERVDGLCSLHDLLSLLAPKTIEAAADNVAFLEAVRRGWEIFAELAPADVADVVLRLLDDPSPLVRELEAQGTTLIHSDVHFGNAVLLPDRLVLVDWALACQAPPTVELTWFLDQSFAFLDATHDEVVDAFVAAERGRVTPSMLDVACLGELLNAGWQCIHWVDRDPDGLHRASFDWFVARARRGTSA